MLVAVVALVVIGLVGIFTVDSADHRVATTTTTGAPSSSTTAVQASAIEAFVPEAEKFVEEHRGLTFVNPVKVTALSDDAFRQRIVADQKAGADKAQIDKATKVLQALGLIPRGTDVAKAEEALLGGAVVGFYDPKSKDLVVRGVKATPYVREVIVHELTHAAQDQHFNIDRPDLDKADDERADGFSALVEGDAVRIENAYRASLTRAEQRQAQQEEQGQSGGVSTDIPEVLIELLQFPYVAGPTFVDAVVRARGQAGLDAAFKDPPTTSEQVLHPEKYLAREGTAKVTPPKPDGPVIDRGVLGEYGLVVLLAPAVDSGALAAATVQAAARGWGGDAYVAWDSGTQSCVRDTMVMDTPADTNQLVSALRAYAATRKGVGVSGAGPVVLTSCG